MGQGPEPDCTWAIDETPQWIARERDAAWTAKLVILRVQRLDDIAHFGDCLREHERHIEELAHLTRAQTGGTEAWTYREPSFVTRDPHVIGGLLESEEVLDAMVGIEATRIACYVSRDRSAADAWSRRVERLLERHLLDARARLNWLQRRRGHVGIAREAAA